jgi:hypothetical protein
MKTPLDRISKIGTEKHPLRRRSSIRRSMLNFRWDRLVAALELLSAVIKTPLRSKGLGLLKTRFDRFYRLPTDSNAGAPGE